MPRAIDFHVHLPIAEFMDGAIGKYRAAVEQYFHVDVKLRDIEEIADYYAEARHRRRAAGVGRRDGHRPEAAAERYRRRDRAALPTAIRGFRQCRPAQGRPGHRRDRAGGQRPGTLWGEVPPWYPELLPPATRVSHRSSSASPRSASQRFSIRGRLAWARTCPVAAPSN